MKVIARSWRGLHHELEAGTNKDNQLDVVDKVKVVVQLPAERRVKIVGSFERFGKRYELGTHLFKKDLENRQTLLF